MNARRVFLGLRAAYYRPDLVIVRRWALVMSPHGVAGASCFTSSDGGQA